MLPIATPWCINKGEIGPSLFSQCTRFLLILMNWVWDLFLESLSNFTHSVELSGVAFFLYIVLLIPNWVNARTLHFTQLILIIINNNLYVHHNVLRFVDDSCHASKRTFNTIWKWVKRDLSDDAGIQSQQSAVKYGKHSQSWTKTIPNLAAFAFCISVLPKLGVANRLWHLKKSALQAESCMQFCMQISPYRRAIPNWNVKFSSSIHRVNNFTLHLTILCVRMAKSAWKPAYRILLAKQICTKTYYCWISTHFFFSNGQMNVSRSILRIVFQLRMFIFQFFL